MLDLQKVLQKERFSLFRQSWHVVGWVCLTYLVFAGTYIWQSYQSEKNFLAEIHQSQNKVQADAVDKLVQNYLLAMRRSLRVYVDTHLEKIDDLIAQPENDVLYDQIFDSLINYFPDMGAFTIADTEGKVLFQDMDGTISKVCERDIKALEHNPHASVMSLHPNPNFPHIDIMVPLVEGEQRGVFYINIPAEQVVKLLKGVTFQETHTMLVKLNPKSNKVWVDFTDEGYRFSTQGKWVLNFHDLQILPFVQMKKVEGTRWTAVAYTNAETLAKDQQVLVSRIKRAVGLMLLLGLLFLPMVFYFYFQSVKAKKKLAYLAFHDPLTGLLNRAQFNDQLAQNIALAKRTERTLAVLFLDLNGFKPINDNYGHQVGDEVLKAVARRLKQVVRTSDVVARIGGDEFVVVLNEIKGMGDVLKVMEKISRAIEQPIQVGGLTLSVSASIGYAMLDDATQSAEALVQLADQQMYEVKQAFHQQEEQEHAQKREEKET